MCIIRCLLYLSPVCPTFKNTCCYIPLKILFHPFFNPITYIGVHPIDGCVCPIGCIWCLGGCNVFTYMCTCVSIALHSMGRLTRTIMFREILWLSGCSTVASISYLHTDTSTVMPIIHKLLLQEMHAETMHVTIYMTRSCTIFLSDGYPN